MYVILANNSRSLCWYKETHQGRLQTRGTEICSKCRTKTNMFRQKGIETCFFFCIPATDIIRTLEGVMIL